MRKVIVTEFPNFDGVYEDFTAWQSGYSPDSGRFKRNELFESGALLLGRVTYQNFARYWPTATGTGAVGERMKSWPKFVATTLTGDVAAAVATLKRQEGGDRLVYGSGTLVQTLLRCGLVDELRLMVYPLVLGSGERLPLKLAASRDLSAGVLLLTCHPVAER